MAADHDLAGNALLAALPEAELKRLLPSADTCSLSQGQVIYEPGDRVKHLYFPTTAIVALLNLLRNGASAEIAVVGSEGLVGVALFMGGGSTTSRVLVQRAGQTVRVQAQAALEEFGRAGVFMHLLLRYTQALITQMAQTAVCNRHHSTDQQICRWLLLTLDRGNGNELAATQDMIASMLGVRRESVTDAALKLQRAGVIRYSRGHLFVLDRPGLEARSCECYRAVRQEYERLLPEMSRR